MKNFIHLLPSLAIGGAERQLVNLACYESKKGFEPKVITLFKVRSHLKRELISGGVELIEFDFKNSFIIIELIKLVSLFCKLNSKDYTLKAWMYHCMLISVVVKLFNPKMKVLWLIRRTDVPNGLTRGVCYLCALFSPFIPNCIIFNARAAVSKHLSFGFANSNYKIVPNSIDTELYSPSFDNSVLPMKSVPKVTKFACVGRYLPSKGYEVLLEALLQIKEKDFICVLVGRGIKEAKSLQSYFDSQCLKDKLFILGEQQELNNFYGTLDFVVSPSLSEGFSNVVAEAMSCSVPCIVTDVGESANIVNNSGKVIASNNVAELSNAIACWLQTPKDTLLRLGNESRKSITARFSLEATYKVYRDIM